MKITFIVTKLNFDGGGENLDIIMKVKALKELGHEAEVVTLFSEANKVPADAPFRIFEERSPSHGLIGSQIFAVKTLKKYQARTDIFYLVGGSFLFGAGWYRLIYRGGRPIAADLNGYSDFVGAYFKKEPLYPASHLPWRKNLWREIKHAVRLGLERSLGVFLMNHLDAFVFMTETIKNYYRRVGVRHGRTAVIESFMDIAALQELPRLDNPLARSTESAFNILCVGRFHVDKGVDLLLEAFVGLDLSDAVLHLVGEGPEKAALEEMVNKKGLSGKVKFYPWQKAGALAAFYQHADLFVHPARLPEPMIRTTIEAMAFGLPLVVSNTGGQAWLGEVAKIYAWGNPADLRAKIRQARADEAFLRQAGASGKKRARELDYRNQAPALNSFLRPFNRPLK